MIFDWNLPRGLLPPRGALPTPRGGGWATWFYASNIPFNAANKLFFKAMKTSMRYSRQYSQVYDPCIRLTRKRIGGDLLDNAIKKVHTEQGLGAIVNSVMHAGYTFSSDGVTDNQGIPLLNFCIGTAGKGALVDIKTYLKPGSKDSEFVLGTLEEGFETTVDALVRAGKGLDKKKAERLCIQVITDGATTCQSARKEFVKDRPWMTEAWCALHCISLFFKDCFNVDYYFKMYKKVHSVVKYAKSHGAIRSAYDEARKANIRGQIPTSPALALPADTRMAGKWSLLDRAVKSTHNLKAAFGNDEVRKWRDRQTAEEKAKFDKLWEHLCCPILWPGVEETIKYLRPAFVIMRLADSDGEAMSWMYGLSLRVAVHFKNHADRSNKKLAAPYETSVEVLRLWKKRWGHFTNPLHHLGYVLNPAFTVDNPTKDASVHSGCAVALGKFCLKDDNICDKQKAAKVMNQLMLFSKGNSPDMWVPGTESFDLRKIARKIIMNFLSDDFKELKEVASKVLEQPVSSAQCERVWSSLNWIQGRLRGRLLPQNSVGLLRVYYGNAQEEKKKRNSNFEDWARFMGEDYTIPEEWLGYEDEDEEAEDMASPESGEVELTPEERDAGTSNEQPDSPDGG